MWNFPTISRSWIFKTLENPDPDPYPFPSNGTSQGNLGLSGEGGVLYNSDNLFYTFKIAL